jgi:hypothetical protein
LAALYGNGANPTSERAIKPSLNTSEKRKDRIGLVVFMGFTYIYARENGIFQKPLWICRKFSQTALTLEFWRCDILHVEEGRVATCFRLEAMEPLGVRVIINR